MHSAHPTSRNLHPDSALLADLKLGLPQAVTKWYERYQPLLTVYVQHQVSNTNDVEELVRETFLNCLRHLPLFQGKSSIKTWMISIARHEIADYYRKRYAKKVVKALPFSELLLDEPVRDMHQTSQVVKVVLKKLKKEYRELLLLKYVDNLSVQAIAQLLHRSIKSIESDLFRARREFKLLYSQLSTT